METSAFHQTPRPSFFSATPRAQKFLIALVPALAALCAGPAFAAGNAAPLSTLGRMPVREVTVFKDGYAFVARDGAMVIDADGNVVLDELPAAVLGTFWPYSTDANAKLTGVVASRRRVSVERTALSLRELLEANVGAEGVFTEDTTNHYTATILSVPERGSEELAATSPPGAGERLPEKGSIILLKTAEGVRAVAVDRIQDVTFKKPGKLASTDEEFRDLLTLKLDWEKRRPAKTVNVGLLYLQKGLRWIPNYKVTLDGSGQATVKLQATLINELTDLDDVSLNLVIGVPTFYFKDTIDPIALQQTAAQLSRYFQNDQNQFGNNGIASMSNAIMSQQARGGEYAGAAPEAAAPVDLGPDVAASNQNEDLYVFNLKHVSLKKGERMVLPVSEFTIPYQDVFTLELPFGPPPEARAGFNPEQGRELAALMERPKVMHKARLTNKSAFPLTTAPALVLREGRVLAQGLMTYTPAGSQCDLALTTAVDVQAAKNDVEIRRTPNAITIRGERLTKIELSGKVTVTNHRKQPVDLEVTRYVLGTVDSAGHDGKITKLNRYEDSQPAMGGGASFRSSYGWADWSNAINGVGRVTWNLTLEPATPVDLECEWSYYWQ